MSGKEEEKRESEERRKGECEKGREWKETTDVTMANDIFLDSFRQFPILARHLQFLKRLYSTWDILWYRAQADF